MNRKKPIFATALATAGLVAAFAATGPAAANAATPAPATHDQPTQSCWVSVSTQQSLCVPTGSDLIAAVQDEAGITISVPAGTNIAGLTVSTGRVAASRFSPASANTETVVSGIYDDVNYGGGSLFLTATGPGCGWTLSNLATFGWNDRASSFKSFSGCRTALFQNINFGGTHVGFATSVASLGSFNDQASSWETE